MIILDMGSSTTCRNDKAIVEKMIDSVAENDPGVDRIVIKWQLFKDTLNVPGLDPIKPLDHDVYLHAVEYAARYNYETTASVFDSESLEFLIKQKPTFIKIACRNHCYGLLAEIDEESFDLVISVGNHAVYKHFKKFYPDADLLCCVPQYPANTTVYEGLFSGLLHYGISDHTEGLGLYRKYKPTVWEKHFALEDSTGPDAASFAIRPKELKELGSES